MSVELLTLIKDIKQNISNYLGKSTNEFELCYLDKEEIYEIYPLDACILDLNLKTDSKIKLLFY